VDINTSIVEVDFGCKSLSMRLISPFSEVMKFTERDILASPFGSCIPFWGFVWPGGYGLTRWILEESCDLKGSVMVDIGSGCASASIAAKMRGAAVVIANDIDPFACAAAVENSRCNGTSGVTACQADLLPVLPNQYHACVALDVLHQLIALRAPGLPPHAPRLLVLGDMLYDSEIGPRILALAEAACTRGWRVATGDPGRCIAVSQGRRLGKRAATFDLNPELRANNHGLSSTSVYVAGGT
jgi:predicted nicotinamide N-methyase